VFCGILIIRRDSRIRCARKAWESLANRVGLYTMPVGSFRVTITGFSSGVGKACAEILHDYPSVSIVTIGRSATRFDQVFADLRNKESVIQASRELCARWYSASESSSAGSDIVINNAGVFSADNLMDVWRVNVRAPCLLTESVVSRFLETTPKNRSLRFVQVASRLEKQSELTADQLRTRANSSSDISIPVSAMNSYADSKRELVLHTAYMSQKYQNNKILSFVAITPGMVNTNLGRHSTNRLIWWLSAPIRFLFLRHPIEGAVHVLCAAFSDPSLTGVYFGDNGEIIENIVETRDVAAGELVSKIVNRVVS
jgi:NAD(P)-dependent dehydrogenase (short-subunit alcohol dehydrogenase family)